MLTHNIMLPRKAKLIAAAITKKVACLGNINENGVIGISARRKA